MKESEPAPSPPALARGIVCRLLCRHEALDLLADLDELFVHRAATSGERFARRWYWRQVPGLIWRFAGMRRGSGEALSFVRQDVSYALRSFGGSPGFTVLVVLTLGVGVGAATAVWSVVYPIVLSPLGYPDEDRIVRVWPERNFTQEQFELYDGRVRSFSAFSAIMLEAFTLTGDFEATVIPGAVVTADHFAVFGVEPVRGRTFAPLDSEPGTEPVVIVSHELWLSRFGGREDALGSLLALGGMKGARRTIIGIAPPGFSPLGRPNQVWVPATFERGTDGYRNLANMQVIARLAPGQPIEGARAELATIASSIEPPPHDSSEVATYTVLRFRDALLSNVRPTLLVLLGAVTLVWLLCCANVTSLLFVRNRAREQETSIRRALGASTSRLAKQWMTESLVLATAGGVVGVGLVALFYSSITAFVPRSFPRISELRPGSSLVLIGLLVSLGAALVFGALPAFRGSRSYALRARGGSFGASRARFNQGLVAGELALSLALVTACGLLVKSFHRLSNVDAGFAGESVVSVRLSPSTLSYADEASRRTYFQSVLGAVEAVPGVRAAGAIQLLPMTPAFMGVGYTPSGAPLPDGPSPPVASYRIVSPDFRRAIGIPLLAGRDLSGTDVAGRGVVGLVNETLARSLVPQGEIVGRELRFDDGSPWFTIVGIIGDVHQQRLDRVPIPEVYLPHEQAAWSGPMYVVARIEDRIDLVTPALRTAIWSVDDDVPLSDIRTMHEVVSASLATERGRAVIFSVFASLAFLLSAVGVYGVVSYTVGQRKKEIGLRMAFGASPARVVAETLAQNSRPLSCGLLGGLLLSLGAAPSLRSFLFEVELVDPVVYGAAVTALAVVATAACLVPARRASRVDPLTSLRSDT